MLTSPSLPRAQAPGAFDLDGLRALEFSRLDRTNTAYFDYTGAALYPESLVRRDLQRLTTTVFGNPHSESTPSLASTAALETARTLTLQWFDADPAVYDVVFTANASSAIRILSEAFPFGRRSRLVLSADNHNSVNGLRIAARRGGSQVAYVPLDRELRSLEPDRWLERPAGHSLFAFPAQSNFSGVQHPLNWVGDAQRRGYRVLLDAAAYVPARRLSVAEVPADFVAISYYKLFGYPTGVGALLARRDALALLRRRFFGGGTIQFASVQNQIARSKPDGQAFEDGTPNFLSMPAVCDGLQWLGRLNMPAVERRVAMLTGRLLERLTALGDRVVVYGPGDRRARGGTVAFNLQRDGRVLPYEQVEQAARVRGLAIRGGCFCNPGAAEKAFDQPASRARACLRGPFAISRFRACLGDAAVGALRASVGVPTKRG